ncbi:spectrin beta chain-like [Dendroctonus ponderosae]|uniref:spectrin beta chain-like n=1 Tax=Dendroctonus ponderosae TaxID=77166 RepID=UPI0020359303|nr:spectrin beta chain-like [Dendroctonus ponderosae]
MLDSKKVMNEMRDKMDDNAKKFEDLKTTVEVKLKNIEKVTDDLENTEIVDILAVVEEPEYENPVVQEPKVDGEDGIVEITNKQIAQEHLEEIQVEPEVASSVQKLSLDAETDSVVSEGDDVAKTDNFCENLLAVAALENESVIDTTREHRRLSENEIREKEAIDNRRAHLLRNEQAQQYLSDANEAESWMSEPELYMMVEDRGEDESSVRNFIKKHESLEAAVEAYADAIRGLGETVKALSAEGHPLAEQVAVKQSQLDKLYAGLKDLA